MTQKHTFFLRFYDQTDEAVAKCVDEIKRAKVYVIGHEYRTPKASMNLQKPSHEVVLIAGSEADLKRIARSATIRGIYDKYASGKHKHTGVHARKPGQAAFGWQR